MRLIDADELKTAFPCGESIRTECVRGTIDHMPTIEPEQHWIPCSERLPEVHTVVLTCDTCGGIWICSLIFTGRNNKVCWEDDYGYLHNLDEQIAWMPLPEPYQPEEECL